MKVLCFGDNTSKEAWADKLTRNFAEKNKLPFRGMFNNDTKILLNGCYHTSTFELPTKKIIESKKNFNQFIILDQPQEKYSHHSLFQKTFQLMQFFREKNIEFTILNPKNFERLEYWTNLLLKNKSFCLRPWISHIGYNGYRYTCERGTEPLIKDSKKIDWQNNTAFNKIKNNMLEGKLNENNCSWCIMHEKLGSYNTTRWHDTLQWVTKLKLKNINDLKKLTSPVYYEIRPGNKCNVMCRTCTPSFSHLIEKEWKTINNPYFQTYIKKERRGYDNFDVIDFDTVERVYVTGGEPTINLQFYKFLKDCISKNRINFELRVNSNFVKISKPLRKLFSNFSNLGFTASIDGIPRVQNYVRWKTDQTQVVKNIHMLKNDGHSIACISTVSLYNINTIGDTLEYFEKEFPYMTIQLNYAGSKQDIFSCFNHPNKNMVLKSLKKAMNTNIYYNHERDTKTLLDSLYKHYSGNYKVDITKLQKFFMFNDILDQKRGSNLKDVIPELNACRKYINTQYEPKNVTRPF